MKNLSKAIVVATTSLLVSLSANAFGGKTEAQNLTQCKSTVIAQIGEVERMKTAGMKSRRNFFEAKFRVSNDGERFVVRCRIGQDQVASISCSNGDACSANSIAAVQK